MVYSELRENLGVELCVFFNIVFVSGIDIIIIIIIDRFYIAPFSALEHSHCVQVTCE